MDLIKAVVKMRSTKTQEEIEELERAAVIGYKDAYHSDEARTSGCDRKNMLQVR